MEKTKIISECEYFGYDIYKQIFSIPIFIDGKKTIIEKCNFYTNMNWKGCCAIKINSKWYPQTTEKMLRELKKYNIEKRKLKKLNIN